MQSFGVSVMGDECGLTVFSGLDVQDVAADSISSLRIGQHLDAVVGELLQASELHLLLGGCDVLHFTPFYETERTERCSDQGLRG